MRGRRDKEINEPCLTISCYLPTQIWVESCVMLVKPECWLVEHKNEKNLLSSPIGEKPKIAHPV